MSDPRPRPQIPTANVLAEAEPTSMQELFSRFPLTARNVAAIVVYMREQRTRLEATETIKHARVARDDSKPKHKKGTEVDLDFSDLGI
jgi:hypothetical protein